MKYVKRFVFLKALLAMFFLYNPSGYSYYHWAIGYEWSMSPETGFVALLGTVLLCITLYFLYQSLRVMDWLGNLLYVLVLACVTFICYTASLLETKDGIIWYVMGALFVYNLWGMSYTRLKFGTHRNRQVDDADTDDDR